MHIRLRLVHSRDQFECLSRLNVVHVTAKPYVAFRIWYHRPTTRTRDNIHFDSFAIVQFNLSAAFCPVQFSFHVPPFGCVVLSCGFDLEHKSCAQFAVAHPRLPSNALILFQKVSGYTQKSMICYINADNKPKASFISFFNWLCACVCVHWICAIVRCNPQPNLVAIVCRKNGNVERHIAIGKSMTRI